MPLLLLTAVVPPMGGDVNCDWEGKEKRKWQRISRIEKEEMKEEQVKIRKRRRKSQRGRYFNIGDNHRG